MEKLLSAAARVVLDTGAIRPSSRERVIKGRFAKRAIDSAYANGLLTNSGQIGKTPSTGSRGERNRGDSDMEKERVNCTQQPRKSDICRAIIHRANEIACAVAEQDHRVVRGIWDNFHTKYPELQALLLAMNLLADKDDHLIPGFIASLRQHVDVGSTYVWTLPHPAPRYTGWLHRQDMASRDRRLITALQYSKCISAEEPI